MTVGKYARLKSNRERVGKVMSINDYDIVTLKMKDTGEKAMYPICRLEEVEEDDTGE